MNIIREKYEEAKKENNATEWPEYELSGGMVCVNPNGLEAIVMTDGRYPTEEEGYQINDYITEKETILWGAAITEFPDTKEVVVSQVGESLELPPKKRFSISGKCVCRVTMDQEWDSSQKHYVK